MQKNTFYTTYLNLKQRAIADEPINLVDLEVLDEVHSEPEGDTEIEITSDFSNRTELPLNISPEERKLYYYKCRICSKKFSSRYAFTLHVNKHQKRCQHCRATFASWKELENHRDFCPRRFGRIDRRPIRRARFVGEIRRPKLDFKCQLCARKYKTFQHLFQHQFLRCSKRYRTPAWIVKI